MTSSDTVRVLIPNRYPEEILAIVQDLVHRNMDYRITAFRYDLSEMTLELEFAYVG